MEEQELTYHSEWIMELYIVGLSDSVAFSSAGIYPLLAGYDKDRRSTYIGGSSPYSYDCAVCNTHYSGSILYPITEGMKRKNVCIEVECCMRKVLLFPSTEYAPTVEIYCLRYAPDAYPDYSDQLGKGIDKTGPFSWMPVQAQPERWPGKKPILRRVLSAEEAVLLEREGMHTVNSEYWMRLNKTTRSKEEEKPLSDFIMEESDPEEIFESVHSGITETGGLIQMMQPSQFENRKDGDETESDSDSEVDFVSFVGSEDKKELSRSDEGR